MDPIYTEPRPDVESLPADTTLRLYTATNTRCVAEGGLVLYGERTWGDTRLVVGRRDGRATRMVVRLTKKYIPGAFALHPGEGGGEPQALDHLKLGTLVLWDAVSWRLFWDFVLSFCRRRWVRVLPPAIVNMIRAVRAVHLLHPLR